MGLLQVAEKKISMEKSINMEDSLNDWALAPFPPPPIVSYAYTLPQ